MKHKNAEMIKAKVDNMKLVVFYRLPNEEWWQQDSECEALPDEVEIDYFLCLPQHKDACLHWLNGGKSQAEYTKSSYPYWCDIDSDEANWSDGHIFMDKNLNIRIKPNKEKRWIAIKKGNKEVGRYTCETLEEAKDMYIPRWWSHHEVEIEVEV